MSFRSSFRSFAGRDSFFRFSARRDSFSRFSAKRGSSFRFSAERGFFFRSSAKRGSSLESEILFLLSLSASSIFKSEIYIIFSVITTFLLFLPFPVDYSFLSRAFAFAFFAAAILTFLVLDQSYR